MGDYARIRHEVTQRHLLGQRTSSSSGFSPWDFFCCLFGRSFADGLGTTLVYQVYFGRCSGHDWKLPLVQSLSSEPHFEKLGLCLALAVVGILAVVFSASPKNHYQMEEAVVGREVRTFSLQTFERIEGFVIRPIKIAPRKCESLY